MESSPSKRVQVETEEKVKIEIMEISEMVDIVLKIQSGLYQKGVGVMERELQNCATDLLLKIKSKIQSL